MLGLGLCLPPLGEGWASGLPPGNKTTKKVWSEILIVRIVSPKVFKAVEEHLSATCKGHGLTQATKKNILDIYGYSASHCGCECLLPLQPVLKYAVLWAAAQILARRPLRNCKTQPTLSFIVTDDWVIFSSKFSYGTRERVRRPREKEGGREQGRERGREGGSGEKKVWLGRRKEGVKKEKNGSLGSTMERKDKNVGVYCITSTYFVFLWVIYTYTHTHVYSRTHAHTIHHFYAALIVGHLFFFYSCFSNSFILLLLQSWSLYL